MNGMNEQKFIRDLELADVPKLIEILVKATPSEDRVLRTYFGDQEFEAIRRELQGVRRRGEKRGNVVVLHGIMGGELTTLESSQDQDLIWLNYLRILGGQLRRLELDDTGLKERDRRFQVHASGIMKRPYARLLIALSKSWNVRSFWYDWRKDIRSAADSLRQMIDGTFSSEDPIHLVAHSMGGLVARAFIHRHSKRWEEMWDRKDNGAAGGRLIMMGTPNYGAVAIARVLSGEEGLIRLAGAADLAHSSEELLSVFNSFPGTYQMLPSPQKLFSCKPLFDMATWGKLPVRQQWLKLALQFQSELHDVVDPERMIYIAGFGRETFSDVEIKNGQIIYSVTRAGDGRVPHTLGLLPNVPVRYVNESHGNLPANEAVIRATDEILATGATDLLLSANPERARPTELQWQPDLKLERLEAEIRSFSKVRGRAEGERTDYRDIDRRIEQAVAGGFLGETPQTLLTSKEVSSMSSGPDSRKPRLQLRVVRGLIENIHADAAAVGHYIGVLPQAAEAALDRSVGGLITAYTRRGVIHGDLGRIFILPRTRNGSTKSKYIAIAGMGHVGRFGPGELTSLTRELVWSLVKLDVQHLASILIGSGNGNLDIQDALKAYLKGVAESLREEQAETTLRTLSLVEFDEGRFRTIRQGIKDLIESDFFNNLLDVDFEAVEMDVEPPVVTERRRDVDEGPVTRFNARKDQDAYVFSAITNEATVPERRWDIDPTMLQQATTDLITNTMERPQNLGYYLTRLLLPRDIRKHLHGPHPLVVTVDNPTAQLPWELMSLGPGANGQFLGLDRSLTRQFQTILAPLPEKPEVPLDRLRIIIVGNPTGDLPGAETEANAIAQFWMNSGATVRSLIGNGVTRTDVLRELILNEYDVLHYAGHSYFDRKKTANSGWIMSDGTMTARELSRLDAAPRFVFNNSCESGITGAENPLQRFDVAPTFAEAFFAQGVSNIICTGWPVNDQAAQIFAEELYRNLLKGEVIWKALKSAREKVHSGGYPPEAWGAYQFYGNPHFRLVSSSDGQSGTSAERARRVSVSAVRPTLGPDQIIVKFKATPEASRAIRSTVRGGGSRAGHMLRSSVVVSVKPLFDDADPRASRGTLQFSDTATPAVDPELSGIHVVEVTRSANADKIIEDLEGDETVEYAHRVGLRYPLRAAAAKAVFPGQWGHRKIQLHMAQEEARFPEPEAMDAVVVAVIDTGVDDLHPDLQGTILQYKNFTKSTNRDTDGHGTHVTGIIAARKSAKRGVYGVSGCKILALKALSDPFSGPAYYQSLRYATDHADVINLSLGGAEQDKTEILLVKRAIDRGRIVVAAMGNEREEGNDVNYPAVIKGVIAVGATDQNDKAAPFSNTGKHIVLSAPGVDIRSTIPNGKYASWDGTSMATPYVSGAVALLLATGKFTPAQVRARLIKSADRKAGTSFNIETGFGRLNIRNLLRLK